LGLNVGSNQKIEEVISKIESKVSRDTLLQI